MTLVLPLGIIGYLLNFANLTDFGSTELLLLLHISLEEGDCSLS